MASVYKSVSKKAAQQAVEDSSDEDIQMEELLDGENDTTDSEEEESDDESIEVVKKQLASGFMPKTRVLILTSRGASYRYAQCAWRDAKHVR
jgi:ribosome biogenesis protein BRX1